MVGWIVLGVILVVVLFLIVWVVSVYNNLVKGRNRVENSWSQIDVQLKRRFSLIPNLVETVKGYTKHESEIFGEFAKARNLYTEASKSQNVEEMSQANNMLNSSLSRLIAVSESYPELKANTNYTKMMEELSDTENKISYARQFYNDCVNTYNNSREVFPNVIIANMFNFAKKELFKAEEESRADVKVQF